MTDIKSIVSHIRDQADRVSHAVRIMEVCGTHTVSIHRSGLREFLPKNLKLISGPGCPVCVTPTGYIDALVRLSREGCIIASYGDMVRVPGSESSLEMERANGADVRVVGSAEDALALAAENPSQEVIFAAVGFETTTPATADVVIRAKTDDVRNFSALVSHKLVLPAMCALLDSPECAIDGFLCPGHVSVIIGANAYIPITEKYSRPCVVGGFEPEQILLAIDKIVTQIAEHRAEVENAYSFIAGSEPQSYAMKLINQVFEPADSEWRALGTIPDSGLVLKDEFARFDSAKKFDVSMGSCDDPPGCRCGDVIMGIIDPVECPLFGKRCTPLKPVGPCMVSSEGSCQAWYKYGKI